MYLGIYLQKNNKTNKQKKTKQTKTGRKERKKEGRKKGDEQYSNQVPSARCDFT